MWWVSAVMSSSSSSSRASWRLRAQNTRGVQSVCPVPADFVRQQIQVVMDDLGADVLKTGMLAIAEVVSCVAAEVRTRRAAAARVGKPPLLLQLYIVVVVDPVMVSTSGDTLLEPAAVSRMRDELIPLATLLTPNLPEARLLLGDEQGCEAAAAAEADDGLACDPGRRPKGARCEGCRA